MSALSSLVLDVVDSDEELASLTIKPIKTIHQADDRIEHNHHADDDDEQELAEDVVDRLEDRADD